MVLDGITSLHTERLQIESDGGNEVAKGDEI